MAITSNCAEIIITNPQGSVSFNKLITTTELSPAKTIYSEDRVYLIQNSENVPQTFWWNLEKAIADGYADLEELYDYFVAEIANQCGGGGGGSSYIPPFLKTGGASWSGTGLVYDVTALEYYFNGDKNTSATQVTLDASDPVNNRLDAIVVDEAGVVSVIKGDASASPISPSVDESHILIQYILVEAGSTQPTIAKEDIYLENVEWATSTYTTGTATGSIDFDNAVSPKQGVKCISANADARLGARFVRTTSFDPYQYTMLSMWVRFTGSNVATNKSLNVRFENGAGVLVANTINLFNFGLQRNLLNVWQLVVIPITSFGALPTSVKGLKIIMTGGTVGQARQWDIDLISLTDNSVPAINEQAFNVLKDGALVGQSSSLNFKGAAVNVTKDVIGDKIDVEVIDSGGGALSAITAATAAHTINNAAFQQEWKWDGLGSGIGLKLSTSSTAATSNTQVLFELRKTGATSGIFSGGVLLNVINEDTNTISVCKGAHFEAKHFAATFGKTGADAGYGDVAILGNSRLHFYHNGAVSAFIERSFNASSLRLNAPSDGGVNVVTGSSRAIFFDKSFGDAFIGIGYTTTIKQTQVFGGDSIYGYRASSTHAAVIENESGILKLSANTGLGGGFAPFTPTWQIAIHGTNNNVGIGTTTPNSSAKLEVSSTTKGFAPPRMTTTQRNAIASPMAGLMLYNTTDNKLQCYDGSIWNDLF